MAATAADWEQWGYPIGWAHEEIYYLSANRNKHLIIMSHPSDPYFGTASYLSQTTMQSKFLDPIMAANPYCGATFVEGTGSPGHAWYQSDWDNTLGPALAASLTPLPPQGGGSFYYYMGGNNV